MRESFGGKDALMLVLGCLGLGLFWFTEYLVIPGFSGGVEGISFWTRMCRISSSFFFAILLFRRSQMPRIILMAAIGIQLMTFLLHFGFSIDYTGAFAFLFIFEGFSAAVLILLFARFIASFPLHVSQIGLIGISLVAQLAVLIFDFAPISDKALLRVAVITLCFALLVICARYKNLLSEGLSEKVALPQQVKEYLRHSPEGKGKLLRNIIIFGVGCVVFPALFGFIAELSRATGFHNGLLDTISQLATICSLLILLVVVIIFDKTVTLEKIFVITVPLFATVFYLTPFLWDNEVLSTNIVVKCGYMTYYAALWVFFARSAKRHQELMFTGFAIMQGASVFFISLGRKISLMLLEANDSASEIFAGSALGGLWLLTMLVTAFLGVYFKTRSVKNSVLKENEQPQAAPEMIDVLRTQVESYGKKSGLSPREIEVLSEYLRGRSAASIGQILFISEHTVKTHLRRIYAKAEIHSRQEFLDIIEKEEIETSNE